MMQPLRPDDPHNRTLGENVRPSRWKNPEPAPCYNLVVIGAGTAGLGLGAIGRTIHPCPTQAEAVRKLADAWNRTRLTPFVKKVLDTWLRWRL
uniref:Uncharacterized protein n=1 Tax=Geobacter metallireducens TaxID=28232 RepID=A0A831UEL1_GEOME